MRTSELLKLVKEFGGRVELQDGVPVLRGLDKARGEVFARALRHHRDKIARTLTDKPLGRVLKTGTEEIVVDMPLAPTLAQLRHLAALHGHAVTGLSWHIRDSSGNPPGWRIIGAAEPHHEQLLAAAQVHLVTEEDLIPAASAAPVQQSGQLTLFD